MSESPLRPRRRRPLAVRGLRVPLVALAVLAVLAIGCGDAAREAGSFAAVSPATAASAATAASPVTAAGRGTLDASLAPRRQLDLSGDGWSLWLDRAAAWEQDELFAPPVDVAALPVHPPTGGWGALAAEAGSSAPAGILAVAVPGTVEQYTWDALAAERGGDPPGADTAGDYVGVSWWWRAFDVPAELLAPVAGAPRALQLQFDAVRQRAEVFLNERLVGYDVVGNTPFAVDCGDALHAGRNVLAVRITDPGGNFSWEDADALHWGNHTLPASHGFGGVTGPVRLVSTAGVRLDDLAVLNRPDPGAIVVLARVINPTAQTLELGLRVEILDAVTRESVFAKRVCVLGESCPPGSKQLAMALFVPDAPLWSPDSPRLFVCRAELCAAPDLPSETQDSVSPIDAFDSPCDIAERRFGFRWFAPDGLPATDAAAHGDGTQPPADGAAVLRLNGRRIVLRSAISWGFWPGSGTVPTPELARGQVEAARSLGLDMLNHHRGIAAPGLLDVQDELGLLAYEEPGGYAAHGGDEFCRALAREKLLRMIERDRSHPSLILVNLINEETAPPTDAQRADLAAAHALDPACLMTFTSGWAVDGSDPRKLHARPRDPAEHDAGVAPASADLHESGWSDFHNAPGPGVWRDEFWKGPDDFRRRTENRGEIVFWGEEGAIAAPPRLGAIRTALDGPARNGWDGADLRAWGDAVSRWLPAHGFGAAFPDVDALTASLGAVASDYQARMLENVRLGDVTDGYVINGWEDCKLENHSGLVDSFRHVKGDAARLAAANAPLALVVKLRQSVVAAGERTGGAGTATAGTSAGGDAKGGDANGGGAGGDARAAVAVHADIGVVNERDLRGPHVLTLDLRDAAGRSAWHQRVDADLIGGDTFGQMLATDLTPGGELQPGRYTLVAELRARDAAGAAAADGAGDAVAASPPLATGRDELLVVDWTSRGLPAGGAFLEGGRALRRWFDGAGFAAPPVFHVGLPPLAWVALGDWDPQPREPIPPEALHHVTFTGVPYADQPEAAAGLQARFRRDGSSWDSVEPVTVGSVGGEWSRSEPAPGVGLVHYSARYEGLLVAPEPGRYILHALSDDGVRVWLDDKLLIDHWDSHAPTVDSSAPVDFPDNRGRALKVEYWQGEGEAVLKLFWTTPGRQARTAQLLDDLLRRARDDGTSVLFLHHADRWAELLAARGVLADDGVLEHERYWLGGGFFARESPLLAGLPVNTALGREYQSLVNYDTRRYGLRLRAADGTAGAAGNADSGAHAGLATIIGCVAGHEFEPASALVTLPFGKGRILLNTLDLVHNLNGPPGPADVPRTLLANILQWAAAR